MNDVFEITSFVYWHTHFDTPPASAPNFRYKDAFGQSSMRLDNIFIYGLKQQPNAPFSVTGIFSEIIRIYLLNFRYYIRLLLI